MMDQSSSPEKTEITFLSVRQKQGQNDLVKRGIQGCTANFDVIVGVARFIFCFDNVQTLF